MNTELTHLQAGRQSSVHHIIDNIRANVNTLQGFIAILESHALFAFLADIKCSLLNVICQVTLRLKPGSNSHDFHALLLGNAIKETSHFLPWEKPVFPVRVAMGILLRHQGAMAIGRRIHRKNSPTASGITSSGLTPWSLTTAKRTKLSARIFWKL